MGFGGSSLITTTLHSHQLKSQVSVTLSTMTGIRTKLSIDIHSTESQNLTISQNHQSVRFGTKIYSRITLKLQKLLSLLSITFSISQTFLQLSHQFVSKRLIPNWKIKYMPLSTCVPVPRRHHFYLSSIDSMIIIKPNVLA